MPHYIITEVTAEPSGVITRCRVHPVMGGTEAAPQYRKDGGAWRSVAEVASMLEHKDAVFVVNERDGQLLPPERVVLENGKLRSDALVRLVR